MEYEAKNMVEIMEKLITDDDATTAWGMQSEFNRIWKEQKTDSPAYEAHQHIAPTHHLAALQKHAHLAVSAVGRFETGLLPHIPVQRDGGSTFEKNRCEPMALANEFGEMGHALKQEIALRHGQDAGGFAGEELSVCAHRVGLGVDFHVGGQVVVQHVALANATDVFYRTQCFVQSVAFANAASQRGL